MAERPRRRRDEERSDDDPEKRGRPGAPAAPANRHAANGRPVPAEPDAVRTTAPTAAPTNAAAIAADGDRADERADARHAATGTTAPERAGNAAPRATTAAATTASAAPARAATTTAPRASGIQYPSPRRRSTDQPDEHGAAGTRRPVLRTVRGDAGTAKAAKRPASARLHRREPGPVWSVGAGGGRPKPPTSCRATRGPQRDPGAGPARTRGRGVRSRPRTRRGAAPPPVARRVPGRGCRPRAARPRPLPTRAVPCGSRRSSARSSTSPARSSSTRCSWTAARAQRRYDKVDAALGGARGVVAVGRARHRGSHRACGRAGRSGPARRRDRDPRPAGRRRQAGRRSFHLRLWYALADLYEARRRHAPRS